MIARTFALHAFRTLYKVVIGAGMLSSDSWAGAAIGEQYRNLTRTCPEGALVEDSVVLRAWGAATLCRGVPPQRWSN